MQKLKPHKNKAFTLIEVVIVVTIVAIFAAIAILGYNSISLRAKNYKINKNVASLIDMLETSRAKTGKNKAEEYILSQTKYPIAGIMCRGSWCGFTTQIVNIDSLKSIVASKQLTLTNVGNIHYQPTVTAEDKQSRAVQDSSKNGYLSPDTTWNSTATDNRLESFIPAKTTDMSLSDRITAYDAYQKEVLGLIDIPAIYTTDNVFTSTAATHTGRPIERTYPFVQLSTFCNIDTKDCANYVGYYLYGSNTQCLKLKDKTIHTSDILYNTYGGSEMATNHNMTFCITFFDSNSLDSFPGML